MKTKLVLLFSAVLALTSLSSCVDPYYGGGYGYGRSTYTRPSYRSYGYSGGYRAPSYGGSHGYRGHHGGYSGHHGSFGGGGYGGHSGGGHHR